MKIEGFTVIFKSTGDTFEDERAGKKPYTVRLLDEYEYAALDRIYVRKITIEHADKPDEERFTREVISVHTLGELFGKKLVGIAWRHK